MRDDENIYRCPECSRWCDITVDWCTCRYPACWTCCIDHHDPDKEAA